MALVSPRAARYENPLDDAAAVPRDWAYDVEHRRKLAEAIQETARYVRDLPAYAGVWRSASGTPAPTPIGTAWTPISGYTETRPSPSRILEPNSSTGEITVPQPGIYGVSMSFFFQGQNNRTIDFGIREDGVDPANPFASKFVYTNNGTLDLNFSSFFTIPDVPRTYVVVVRDQTGASTFDFEDGGVSMWRIDYIEKDSVEQDSA